VICTWNRPVNSAGSPSQTVAPSSIAGVCVPSRHSALLTPPEKSILADKPFSWPMGRGVVHLDWSVAPASSSGAAADADLAETAEQKRSSPSESIDQMERVLMQLTASAVQTITSLQEAEDLSELPEPVQQICGALLGASTAQLVQPAASDSLTHPPGLTRAITNMSMVAEPSRGGDVDGPVVLWVPMIYKDAVGQILLLKNPDGFSRLQLALAQSIAMLLAAALPVASQLQAESRLVQLWSDFGWVNSRAIATEQWLKLARCSSRAIWADLYSVQLADDRTVASIQRRYSCNADGVVACEGDARVNVAPGIGVVGLCAVEGSPINIKDVMNDDRYSARNDRHGFTDGKSKAMLAVPIGQTPQVRGVLLVSGCETEDGIFGDAQLSSLSKAAEVFNRCHELLSLLETVPQGSAAANTELCA